jgi:decaprenylphospho-beta-D-ribofuranose 2-oxidase
VAVTGQADELSLLTGWGRTSPTAALVVRASDQADVTELLRGSGSRGLVARGLGRSYGDAAQNAGGTVVDMTGVDDIGSVVDGRVVVGAGVSLHDLMLRVVPQGWFPPVLPGTRHVTVGGALAADIHGKNHHRDGSFADHVTSVELAAPAWEGEARAVGPLVDPDAFWASAGGMGMTGIVVALTLRLQPIQSSLLSVDTERTTDLDDSMARMLERDDQYRYSVAWVDCAAGGTHLGRGVLTRADHAPLDALAPAARTNPLQYEARALAAAPPWMPPGVLNRLTIGAFNEFWYHKAPRREEGRLQTISTFFHPLDAVDGWNRIYGRPGFLQYQLVVPDGAEGVVRHAIESLRAAGYPSFLAVLKRFGPAGPAPLSFPIAGWTLTVDVPAVRPAELAAVLDRLDDQVAAAGGRIYLAKDSRLQPELLPIMYPRLDEWRAVVDRLDPDGHLASDLSRRVGLRTPAGARRSAGAHDA